MIQGDLEIRVRVMRMDIERAAEEDGALAREHTCAVAQALMRLGFIGVEVYEDNRLFIGMDEYDAIDERPGGERLSRFIQTFDEWLDAYEPVAEPDGEEFVLRRRR